MAAERSPSFPSVGKSFNPSSALAKSDANYEITALSLIMVPSVDSRIGTKPPLKSRCH